jgi:hypothetical protein
MATHSSRGTGRGNGSAAALAEQEHQYRPLANHAADAGRRGGLTVLLDFRRGPNLEMAKPRPGGQWTPERRAAQAERAKGQKKPPFESDFESVKTDFEGGLSSCRRRCGRSSRSWVWRRRRRDPDRAARKGTLRAPRYGKVGVFQLPRLRLVQPKNPRLPSLTPSLRSCLRGQRCRRVPAVADPL